MGAVRNAVSFSTIEADVHHPVATTTVPSRGGASRTNDTQAQTPRIPAPMCLRHRGHAQVALVVLGSSQLPPMANPVDASAKERANAPVRIPLAQQAVSWLPCLPGVKRAQHPRNCAAGDHRRPCRLRRRCCRWTPRMRPRHGPCREVRRMATRPGLTGIGGSTS